MLHFINLLISVGLRLRLIQMYSIDFTPMLVSKRWHIKFIEIINQYFNIISLAFASMNLLETDLNFGVVHLLKYCNITKLHIFNKSNILFTSRNKI